MPSDSRASSVATASPTCIAVAIVRRLRRATLRRPICTLRGAHAPQQRVEAALPADRRAGRLQRLADGQREARRIAGAAASGGPISPTTMLATSTPASTCTPVSMPKKVLPK